MVSKKRFGKREFERTVRREKKLKIEPELKKVFSLIGVPEETSFVPDPFQLEAVRLVKESDVLVSAPTGSGKTWIASEAINLYLSMEKRTWYATPLKALSNSIYEIFQKTFGPSLCGILTGDRKENPDAPIIVGTTEILRNQLYDAMYEGEDLKTDLVILDEAHYMSDADRGVVWEEVMIYLPSRIRLILLSATISNAEELAGWLSEVRGSLVRVVKVTKRPVPLKILYYDPEGMVLSFSNKRGLSQRVEKIHALRAHKGKRPDYGEIISDLRSLNLLPAIFFLKSREDCDRAIHQCYQTKGDEKLKQSLWADVEAFLRQHPHLADHRQLDVLLNRRVASHHAGQLPSWKLLVERMMNQGYLEAIFATSTVAAGVNFPARTVVLLQSDRYNGRGFVGLTSTEFHQMIGRAGRRGKDSIGFVLVVPGPHQDIRHLYELSKSPPEPIRSQLKINFSMVLNLLLSHTPSEIRFLLERSFLTFKQENDFLGDQGLGHLKARLKELVRNGRCDDENPFEVKEEYLRYRTLKRELETLRREGKENLFASKLKEFFPKGRVIGLKDGSLNVVLYHHHVQRIPELVCVGVGKGKKGRRKAIKRARLQDVERIYNQIEMDISDMDRLAERLKELSYQMEEINLNAYFDQDLLLRIRNRELALAQTQCHGCQNHNVCHGRQKLEMVGLLEIMDEFRERVGPSREEVWLSFERHLKFLKSTGFVDEQNRLTYDGYWASKLRLDHPLLIAELIRKGSIAHLGPELIAASLGPFVWDRSQEVFLRTKGRLDILPYEDLYERILEDLLDMLDKLEANGFAIPQIPFWPGVAIYAWAQGMSWQELMGVVKADEGDVASLIVRTVDHLRQVSGLKDTHPELAQAAEIAIGLLMREPIYQEQVLE